MPISARALTSRPSRVVALCLSLASGCGGNVVFEEQGAGGSGAVTSTDATSVTSTSTGGLCASNADCGPGSVCLLGTGVCADACEPFACDSCGQGSFCEPCATSSCPTCDDCVAACMPKGDGRCDDDDPCTDGFVCMFQDGYCAPPCGPMGDCGGFAFCDECATGSCCGCRNCVAACIGGR